MTNEQDALRARLGATLLDDLPDAVIYCDREGFIRFWNAGAERIFGFRADQALGRSLDIIIPERLRERHWRGYHAMMVTGHSRHAAAETLSVPALTRDGDRISVDFTVAPVKAGDGQVVGIVALLRDVTATFLELKRLKSAD